ncbi:unnamed protein product [Effrenium voratum]|nr:unnamed protein product [Effrenium voratum]
MRRKRDAVRGDKPVQFSMFDPIVAYDAISTNWVNVPEVAKLGIQAAHKKIGLARQERSELQVALDNLQKQLRGMQEHNVQQIQAIKDRIDILNKTTKRKKKYRKSSACPTEQELKEFRSNGSTTLSPPAAASRSRPSSGRDSFVPVHARRSSVKGHSSRHLELAEQVSEASSDESSVGVSAEQQTLLDQIEPLKEQTLELRTGLKKEGQRRDVLLKRIERVEEQLSQLDARVKDELSPRALSLLFRQIILNELPATVDNSVSQTFEVFKKLTDSIERRLEDDAWRQSIQEVQERLRQLEELAQRQIDREASSELYAEVNSLRSSFARSEEIGMPTVHLAPAVAGPLAEASLDFGLRRPEGRVKAPLADNSPTQAVRSVWEPKQGSESFMGTSSPTTSRQPVRSDDEIPLGGLAEHYSDLDASGPKAVPPVYVEVAMEQAAGQLEGDTGRRLISEEVFDLAVGSLNLFQQPLRQDVRARIGEYDVFCMQEVTPSTLPAILSAGRELGYDVVSPAQRGHSTLEGFDVCMLLRNATVTRLRVGVVPLTAAGVRHLLHVQVQVTKNGACLALATAHCTASAEFAAQRASEMEVVWNALEALPVGGCIFAGDTNTHASEKMPERYQERWQDAWEADGAEVTLSGTWCHDWMDTSHPSVQAWRFDRCFFLSRAFRRAVPEDEGATFLSATQQPPGASLLSASESQPGDRPVPRSARQQTVRLVQGSFQRVWGVGMSDHACISSRFLVQAGAGLENMPQAEYLRVEQPVVKELQAIQTGTEQTTVTKQTKVDIYASRLEKLRLGGGLSVEAVRKMSLSQFVGRIDRRGRNLSLRKKPAIVKEKPYLNLDGRRPNASDMARYCLRLHRPFTAAEADPRELSDREAIEQLHAFVASNQCPFWLKKRFAQQNKAKKKKSSAAAPSEARAADCGQEAAHVGSLPTAEQPSHSVAAASNDATVLSVGRPVDVQSASTAACLVATGKDAAFLPVLPTVEQQGQSQSSVAASSNATLLSAAKPAAGATAQSVLEDTSANRASVAEQHGFPWQPAHGEMRYSVQEACQGKKPTPKRLQLELYLEAILGERPRKGGPATDDEDLEDPEERKAKRVDAAFLPADAIALQHVPTKSLREKTKTECRTRMMML